jgi:hypothetical protein
MGREYSIKDIELIQDFLSMCIDKLETVRREHVAKRRKKKIGKVQK